MPGMIADFNPQTGQLDLYNGNQAPHAHRTVYAHVAGLAEHMIRIKCSDIGGGFGNKVPVYPGYVCAIAGSIVAGAPVKWVEDRATTSCRPVSHATTSCARRCARRTGRSPACAST